MDEKDWDILLSIYEKKSISEAAQLLFITQPALTYRLKLIEKQLGIKIYIKGKKFLSFTTEGNLLVDYAQKMKTEHKKLEDTLKDAKDEVSGELRIGVSSNFADFELPDLLKDFHDLYPNVQLKVHTAWSTNVYKSFIEEEDHIGIVRGNYPWKGPRILMSEDEVCIVSASPIAIDDLPALPSIRHQSGPDTKLIVDKWWNDRFRDPPNVSMEVGNLETCKKLVTKGLGYGILPMYCLGEQDLKKNLYIYPLTISNDEPILRLLWTFYREEDTKLSVVKKFIDFIEKRYAIDREV